MFVIKRRYTQATLINCSHYAEVMFWDILHDHGGKSSNTTMLNPATSQHQSQQDALSNQAKSPKHHKKQILEAYKSSLHKSQETPNPAQERPEDRARYGINRSSRPSQRDQSTDKLASNSQRRKNDHGNSKYQETASQAKSHRNKRLNDHLLPAQNSQAPTE